MSKEAIKRTFQVDVSYELSTGFEEGTLRLEQGNGLHVTAADIEGVLLSRVSSNILSDVQITVKPI